MDNIIASNPSLPQTFIVTPPVRAAQVPVHLDPSRGYTPMAYLKTGTAIEVLDRSDLWLLVALPRDERGWVRASLARPATESELDELRQTAALGGEQRRSAGVLTLEAGMARAAAAGPRYTVPFLLIGLGIGSGAISFTVIEAVFGDCANGGYAACQPYAASNPSAAIAVSVFLLLAMLLVAAGVLGTVVEFVARHTVRRSE